MPDKVILLEGPHALLLNRVKYRRIDYTTGRDTGDLLGSHSCPAAQKQPVQTLL